MGYIGRIGRPSGIVWIVGSQIRIVGIVGIVWIVGSQIRIVVAPLTGIPLTLVAGFPIVAALVLHGADYFTHSS
jgi:uncharacterized membrane protein